MQILQLGGNTNHFYFYILFKITETGDAQSALEIFGQWLPQFTRFAFHEPQFKSDRLRSHVVWVLLFSFFHWEQIKKILYILYQWSPNLQTCPLKIHYKLNYSVIHFFEHHLRVCCLFTNQIHFLCHPPSMPSPVQGSICLSELAELHWWTLLLRTGN